MKRILLTLSIVATLGLGANAQNRTNTQTDGFFSYSDASNQERNGVIVTPGAPAQGINADQSAPVGSGLLLLAGMGVAYALRRKND